MTERLSVRVTCEHRGQGIEAPKDTLLTFTFPRGQTKPRGFIPGGRVLVRDRLVPIGDGRMIGTLLDAARSGWLARVVHDLRCDACPITKRITDHELQRKLRLAGHADLDVVEISSL